MGKQGYFGFNYDGISVSKLQRGDRFQAYKKNSKPKSIANSYSSGVWWKVEDVKRPKKGREYKISYKPRPEWYPTVPIKEDMPYDEDEKVWRLKLIPRPLSKKESNDAMVLHECYLKQWVAGLELVKKLSNLNNGRTHPQNQEKLRTPTCNNSQIVKSASMKRPQNSSVEGAKTTWKKMPVSALEAGDYYEPVADDEQGFAKGQPLTKPVQVPDKRRRVIDVEVNIDFVGFNKLRRESRIITYRYENDDQPKRRKTKTLLVNTNGSPTTVWILQKTKTQGPCNPLLDDSR